VQRPSIWTIDLNTDSLISRFEIPESMSATARGLASITVDALDQSDCANTFAYIPDLVGNSILVFSLRSQRMWQFSHNYFNMNPFEGELKI
jgi:dopachrome tautomerase